MVVEVSYAEWTSDGLLRHVVSLGEREDKPAVKVRRIPQNEFG
jgi:ATP-dependent DNA ligase